jgi:hypothetical protein
MNFSDYIKNKRVAFVGGGAILIDRKMGEFIDSFDVVVRTNGSSTLIENPSFVKDYGQRMDVLYTNNQFYREMSPLPIHDYVKKGVKYLRMKTCKAKDLDNFNNTINTVVITEIMKKVNKYCPSSTMGAYIFTDILNCEPKQLYITGIDFFASKKEVFEHDNYQEYFPGYLPDKIRIQGNAINKGKTEDGHSFKGNAGYIHKLWKDHDNMVFPNFIENILIGIIEGRIKQK